MGIDGTSQSNRADSDAALADAESRLMKKGKVKSLAHAALAVTVSAPPPVGLARGWKLTRPWLSLMMVFGP